MSKEAKAYLMFVACALPTGFAAWLLVTSHGTLERNIAPWILAVCGLGAIVLPLITVLSKR